MTHYFICSLFLLVEFFILFKGRATALIGIVTGSLVHLFVLRAVIISILSLVLKTSMHDVIMNSTYFPIINISSFAAQIISLCLFIGLMPLATVKKIMDDKGFYTNLLTLTILLNIFLVYNSNIFAEDYFSVNFIVHEIIVVLLTLSFFYIAILSLIKIFNLGAYKDLNRELEVKINNAQTLTSAVYSFAEVVIEANLTRDSIYKILVDSKEQTYTGELTLSEFFLNTSISRTHPDDLGVIQCINSNDLIRDFQNGISEKTFEFRSKKIDDSIVINNHSSDYIWYRMRINVTLNNSTSEIFAFFTLDDIDEEKQAEILLKKKAETDHLTGSLNRETFAAKVDEYIKNGGRGTLFMFDLDNFKGINDNMGHSAGDNFLRDTYANTMKIFRENDLISRIGGDEFLVFMAGTTEESTVNKKAVSICNTLNKTYIAENGVSIEISCSVGISMAPYDAINFEALFKLSDIAMYHSKSIGKNTYTIYDADEFVGFKPQEKEAYMRQRNTSDEE